MTGPLRWALTAIVLVNLAFVHATEDASLAWLVPLALVTLVSSRLAQFAEARWYRWTWNAIAVAIFGMLVTDTLTQGPEHLLEDGLRLAAVCQVHVLANVGPRQKPDLLFFNSFLIAVVTAFLTQDTTYSVIFALYAVTLVIGLALYAATGAAGIAAGNGAGADAEAAAAAARRVGRDAALRAGIALVVTFAAFTVIPRDFRRKGLLVESLSSGPAALAQVAFSEQVRTDRTSTPSESTSIVMRVKNASGPGHAPPTYWRGATQIGFDGRAWTPGSSLRVGDEAWRLVTPRNLVRSETIASTWIVELRDPSAGVAFLPLDACRASFRDAAPHSVRPMADGTVRFPTRWGRVEVTPFSYEISIGAGDADAAPSDAAALSATASVDPAARAAEAERIAAAVRTSLPPNAPQSAVVEAVRAHLAARNTYCLPGEPGAATNLTAFLQAKGGGDCEMFASAFALILRSLAIPVRVVSGYASDEYDEATGVLTVRRRDAHAWTEVRDPDPRVGWYLVDPTPGAERTTAAAIPWTQRAREWLAATWQSVIQFDDAGRIRAVEWFAGLPARFAALFTDRSGTGWFAACGLLLLLAAIRHRRNRLIPPPVRAWHAAVRRTGLSPRPSETPREFLARARSECPRPPAVRELETATAAHESARFSA